MFQNHVSSNPDSDCNEGVKSHMFLEHFATEKEKALRDIRDSDMKYRHVLKYVNIL